MNYFELSWRFLLIVWSVGSLGGMIGCSHSNSRTENETLEWSGPYLRKLKQVTFSGSNSRPQWAANGKSLVYQHQAIHDDCQQTYLVTLSDLKSRPILNNTKNTLEAGFMPDNSRVSISSPFFTPLECLSPKEPSPQSTLRFPIFNHLQLYSLFVDQSDQRDQIPLEPGAPRAYHGAVAICGPTAVAFVSDRSGEFEIYRGELNRLGTLESVRQISHISGYPSFKEGLSFSPDCKNLTWAASTPQGPQELAKFKKNHQNHALIEPRSMDIWTAQADGTDARPVTQLNALSFSPVFTPNGKQIVFASTLNHHPLPVTDLLIMNADGTSLAKVYSTSSGSVGFPRFSEDGQLIAFSVSNQIYVAQWVSDTPIFKK